MDDSTIVSLGTDVPASTRTARVAAYFRARPGQWLETRERQASTADRAALATLLVESIQANRTIQLEREIAEERAAARLEALQVAVGMLSATDKELERARSTCQALRDELRRYVAAQTSDTSISRAA